MNVSHKFRQRRMNAPVPCYDRLSLKSIRDGSNIKRAAAATRCIDDDLTMFKGVSRLLILRPLGSAVQQPGCCALPS